jgi:hypothetical protein
VTIASAINLRNPDGVFGADPFGLGAASVSRALRLRASVQTIGANKYTFKLGVNAGGRLLVNGTPIIDLPAATGQFQDGIATIDVPPGSIAIEIQTFDNGNPEVQLSYAPAGVDELEIVPTSELIPARVPYHATSQADGTFAITGVPTTLGGLVARASADIGGRPARGRSLDTVPVAAGATAVGDVVIRATGIIGYYDLDLNAGDSTQVGPITTAGLQAVDIGDLNTADLSQVDVLFVQNPNNNGYSAAFRNNLGKVHDFVARGGTLIFHDRHVATASSILPGAPGTILRDFSDDRNVNIVDNTTLVTNGPGGILTDASLDGGNSSSHGWIDGTTIPAGSQRILSQGDPNRLVLYSYTFGVGHVVYSTIPLDFYLGSGGLVAGNMQRYAANVVAYANGLR